MDNHNVSIIKLGNDAEGKINSQAFDQVITKPTLIYLCGIKAIFSQIAMYAGERLQIMLNRRSISNNELDILSIYYPDLVDKTAAIAVKLADLHQAGHPAYTKSAWQMAVKLFLPLVAREFAHDENSVSGVTLPPAQLHKNLRNINLFSVSFGGLFATQLSFALSKMMTDLGYNRDEIKLAKLQISLVTVGDSSLRQEFSCMHLVNLSDQKILEFDPLVLDRVKAALAKSGMADRDFRIVEYGGQGESVLMAVRSFAQQHRSREDGKFYAEDKPFDDPSGHHPFLSMSPGLGALGFLAPGIVAHGLASGLENSVENSRTEALIPLPPPSLALTTAGKANFATVAAEGDSYALLNSMWQLQVYQQRVLAAMSPGLKNQPLGSFSALG